MLTAGKVSVGRRRTGYMCHILKLFVSLRDPGLGEADEHTISPTQLRGTRHSFITDPVTMGGNAITSVRPFVSTLTFDMSDV